MTPEEKEFMATVPYAQAVGALFYLARATRSDLVHACSQVAKFMSDPAPEHWRAVQRIYAYLNRTKDVPLRLKAVGLHQSLAWKRFVGHGDSDWAGDVDTRRSHTGWCVRVGGALVAWHSKQQTCTAGSTAEAELVASNSLARELIWWRKLAVDNGYGTNGPFSLFTDSSSVQSLAQHAGKFDAVKHIQIKYNQIRDYQRAGEVDVRWTPGNLQWSDIFMKNCAVHHFRRIAGFLMGLGRPI